MIALRVFVPEKELAMEDYYIIKVDFLFKSLDIGKQNYVTDLSVYGVPSFSTDKDKAAQFSEINANEVLNIIDMNSDTIVATKEKVTS